MRINIDIDHSSTEEIDQAISFLQKLKNSTQVTPVVGGLFDMPLVQNSNDQAAADVPKVTEIKVQERKSSPITGFNEIYGSLKDERKKRENIDIKVETY